MKIMRLPGLGAVTFDQRLVLLNDGLCILDGETMTPHTSHRWLAVCLGIFLGVLSVNAAAIDPGTVKGQLTYEGKVYTLKHVYAWQPYAQTEELWVYLTDAELPAAAAQSMGKANQLANENRFRGLQLRINPVQPNLKSINAVIYTLGSRPTVGISGTEPRWQRLLVSNNRVVGNLQYKSRDWSLEAEFSAPVFGSTGKMQTLSGAQAQKSPQAEVFLAYEKALLWQGIDAAGAYMTPEKLAEMKADIKQMGADGFKEFQTKRRESTPQGDARRIRIEKLVVDGDYAVLETETDEARLVKTKDGWKIAK